MKRNYLLLVAILFVSSMTLLFSHTHVWEERPASVVSYEPKTEWVFPQTPPFAQPLERIYRHIRNQFVP